MFLHTWIQIAVQARIEALNLNSLISVPQYLFPVEFDQSQLLWHPNVRNQYTPSPNFRLEEPHEPQRQNRYRIGSTWA